MMNGSESTSAPAVIELHDTMSGSKRTLETLEPGKVSLYCCGPTVYDLTHVGKAMGPRCSWQQRR